MNRKYVQNIQNEPLLKSNIFDGIPYPTAKTDLLFLFQFQTHLDFKTSIVLLSIFFKFIFDLTLKFYLYLNCICIPEYFNANISHQLFFYKITFENSQQKKTNLYSKTGLKRLFFGVQKYIWLRFGMTNSINNHLRLKIPYPLKTHIQP